ncbi:Peroxisomal membrane protein PMP27 [Schaereria dolodes]|nr:Peroxisomal membrane protein PMP27 [Schaereria dolodes]
MVADAILYHPTVAHYLRFVATTVGRDKLLRALQYFSRFYAWYLFRTNNPSRLIAPFEAIKKQFGLSRKVMRLGKNVEHFKAAAVAADSKNMDPVLKYCAIGRQLGYATYLSFDMVTFLDACGVRPMASAKRIQQEAYKAWFIGLTFSAIGGVYKLWLLRQQEEGIDRKDGESVMESKIQERERASTHIQLVQDLCDLTIPSAALSYANLDDGIVGLAGTASSLIGVWTTWKKTA